MLHKTLRKPLPDRHRPALSDRPACGSLSFRSLSVRPLPVALAVLGTVSCLGTASAPARAQSPAIYAYLSAPNVQSAPSFIPGKSVETFDESGLTTGNHTNYTATSLGGATYTGTFNVNNDSQYSAGTGNFFTFGAQSGTSTPVTLTFATPINYFGLSYNAGDANNGLTFYDGTGNLIGRYNTATLIAKLNGGSGNVTALDGTTYATTNYYGRPDGNSPSKTASNQDTNEPFAFVNFFASSGLTISKVVFDNSGTNGTGFESDNHTISADASNAPPTTGSFVAVGSISAAPEPGSLAFLLGTVPMGILAIRRRSTRGAWEA